MLPRLFKAAMLHRTMNTIFSPGLRYFRRGIFHYCHLQKLRSISLTYYRQQLIYIDGYSKEPGGCYKHREAVERLCFRRVGSLLQEGDCATHAQQVASTCSGCGSVLQCENPAEQGFIPREKLFAADSPADKMDERQEDNENEDATEASSNSSRLTCKRCFSLKHYNTALNVTLQADDYLRHLSHLKNKRALILLVIDVIDFPGSLFPMLHTLISEHSRVLIVANKIDLLPKSQHGNFWNRLETMILDECTRSSLESGSVMGIVFTSIKSGEGLEKLSMTILERWGNRGDVYLLGCTNVGKSSLFNYLLSSLCEEQIHSDGSDRTAAQRPLATISHWPGTTLGLLSFPLMSVGKKKRLLAQQLRATKEMELHIHGERIHNTARSNIETKQTGLESVRNRFWLHDTPGAINQAQLINLLTTKELNLALPKKSLKPQTFILRPGQCLMIGGLARLDYLDGSESAYFTVFAASYLPVHVTKVEKAENVWSNNLGTPLLKIPFGDSDRLAQFPHLQPQLVSVVGSGWKASVCDVVLSSAGWIAVTARQDSELCLMAHTPGGLGVYCRQPSLCPDAVTRRGKRSRKHRASFTGQ